ncbi:hypothetical protein ACIRSU_20935 [Streptomyces sp. NPDC101160]|uniref:hypothetical protein n=1 Tax=Streptomyces sp. NPDC101160 TaxID=3366118 RepID=UPI0037FEFAC4
MKRTQRVFSIALSTSVVLGVLAMPGTALAAAGPALHAVSGHDTQFGRLFVDDLTTDSDITDVSAVLHPPGDDTALATVHDFALASGDRRSGDWITAGEVRLATAGRYAIDLHLTEADGDETTLKNAGTYDYTTKRYFDGFGVDRPRPTIDDMKVTARGRLMEWQPVTHARTPVSGGFVSVDNGSYREDLRTDADGRFSHWYIADPRPATVQAFSGGLRTEPVRVAPRGLPARVTLDRSDFAGVYDTEVTVTGTVEYDNGGGTWKPALYADVEIVDAAGTHQGSGVTDKDGRFRFTTKIPFAADKRVLGVSYGDWFANRPTAPLTFRTTAVSDIRMFEAELGLDSQLTVSGFLNVAGAPRPVNTLDIQVSPNGRDGWKKLGTVRLTSGDTYFRGTLPAPASGYYRAVYAGSATVRGAMGPVVRASRIATSISPFKVPATVRKGGTIAVSGRLQHAVPNWRPYAGQPVTIYFTPKARPTESYLLGQVKTAADGTFKANFKERGDGWIFASHVHADPRHLWAKSPRIFVDVR